jgi:hypothetical protein
MLIEIIVVVVLIIAGIFIYSVNNKVEFNEELAKEIYKVEPKVEVVEKKSIKTEKKVKEKRSWYNNGKEQKLIPESKTKDLDKSWKKGKLPKQSKGDK